MKVSFYNGYYECNMLFWNDKSFFCILRMQDLGYNQPGGSHVPVDKTIAYTHIAAFL